MLDSSSPATVSLGDEVDPTELTPLESGVSPDSPPTSSVVWITPCALVVKLVVTNPSVEVEVVTESVGVEEGPVEDLGKISSCSVGVFMRFVELVELLLVVVISGVSSSPVVVGTKDPQKSLSLAV